MFLFLESPSERGKERSSITSVAQPARVGSCFIPHQWNKGKRRLAAGCAFAFGGASEGCCVLGCSSFLEKPFFEARGKW